MGEHLKALERIAQKRSRLAIVLTILIVIVYFTFLGMVAFAKDTVALLVSDGLSLGIALGLVTTLTVWFTTIIYIYWSNTYYDQAVDRIRSICIKRQSR